MAQHAMNIDDATKPDRGAASRSLTGHKTVIGLGKTGLSCVRFLINKGYKVCVTDSRVEPPGLAELQQYFPSVPVHVGAFDAEMILQADELIVSPGVSLQEPLLQAAQQQQISVLGDIELFRREITAPVVAITGSNAKTTVTTWVGDMAKASAVNVAVGGNIGTPVLDLLAQPEAELYVLELSSFQLETVAQLQADVACVLNVSPDHLDRYESMQAYTLAKHRVFNGCQRVVTNRHDALTQLRTDYCTDQHIAQFSFGLDRPGLGGFGVVEQSDGAWLAFENDALLPVSALTLRGEHQISNALAALAIGYAVGLDREAMLTTLQQFQGLPHRCQWVDDIDNVTFINDSKGTNIGAAQAAIASLSEGIPQRVVLIAGGEGKGADFSALRDTLQQYVKHAVLIGHDAALLQAQWSDCVACSHAKTLQAAVKMAADHAQPGDVVLLSPACASFDMFSGYEQRGDEFIQAVQDYKAERDS